MLEVSFMDANHINVCDLSISMLRYYIICKQRGSDDNASLTGMIQEEERKLSCLFRPDLNLAKRDKTYLSFPRRRKGSYSYQRRKVFVVFDMLYYCLKYAQWFDL